MKQKIEKIVRWIVAIFIYGLGFYICDGTFWKELILVFLVLIGGKIQND